MVVGQVRGVCDDEHVKCLQVLFAEGKSRHVAEAKRGGQGGGSSKLDSSPVVTHPNQKDVKIKWVLMGFYTQWHRFETPYNFMSLEPH